MNPKFNNLSTVDASNGDFGESQNFGYQNYHPATNGRVYFKNMPPEVMQKLRDGEIKQLGPEFNCFVKLSPSKLQGGYDQDAQINQDYAEQVNLFDQSTSQHSPFKTYVPQNQGSQFCYGDENPDYDLDQGPKLFGYPSGNVKHNQVPKQMSFVEFDSNNAVIKTILEEIDLIMTKLDLRANQIARNYSPQKVESRLRAMSPEIKNLRRKTIDLVRDGETVLERMSRFKTDDRSKYNVQEWVKNLNSEKDLRKVLLELRTRLRDHIKFLKSHYPQNHNCEHQLRQRSRETVKRPFITRRVSPLMTPNHNRRNTQERFERVEGQLKEILQRLGQINKPSP